VPSGLVLGCGGQAGVLPVLPVHGRRWRRTSLALPYQAVLHTSTERPWGSAFFQGSVVVFDEAHNLVDTVTGIYSTTLSLRPGTHPPPYCLLFWGCIVVFDEAHNLVDKVTGSYRLHSVPAPGPTTPDPRPYLPPLSGCVVVFGGPHNLRGQLGVPRELRHDVLHSVPEVCGGGCRLAW